MNRNKVIEMGAELRVLVLEDSEDDVDLIRYQLCRGGLKAHCQQVQKRKDFLQELQEHPPDVILSDHGLPSFDGFTALSVAREKCPDTPFIFVTAGMGQIAAIQAFENGAADFVHKDRLSGLVPAVQRAVWGIEERTKAERPRPSEAVAQEEPAKVPVTGVPWGDVKRVLAYCLACQKVRSEFGQWVAFDAYLQQNRAVTVMRTLCPDCVESCYAGNS
jgi:CheY-like chemotaxis protein